MNIRNSPPKIETPKKTTMERKLWSGSVISKN